KMCEPRYQEFSPERIPSVQVSDEVEVKVIAGRVGDVEGPISQPATRPIYLDISMAAGAAWEYGLPEGHNAFAYVFEGSAQVGGDSGESRELVARQLGVLGGGRRLGVRAGASGARLILVAGHPLREPVARH